MMMPKTLAALPMSQYPTALELTSGNDDAFDELPLLLPLLLATLLVNETVEAFALRIAAGAAAAALASVVA